MKFLKLLFLVPTAFVVITSTAVAQDFSIDWYSIDGGGGTSAGSGFTLNGTIGQADANTTPMTSPEYSLTGGFWSSLAMLHPRPALTILKTSGSGIVNDSIVILWPSSFDGFVLQENPDLSGPDWTDVSVTPTSSGENQVVLLPPAEGNRFYRLVQR